jgi:predicted dehydrogenase
MTHGFFESGAAFSFSLRGGPPFKDTPGLEWRIYGEDGEIRLAAPGGLIQIGYPDIKISVHDFANGKNEVTEVELDVDHLDRLVVPTRNVGRVYEAIAAGETGEADVVCTFENAVERHRYVEEIYRQNS